MKDQNQKEVQLINELGELRKRIADLETLENERKQTEEALRKSEERYRTLFEESRDAIYTTTQEGEFLDANQSMVNLFGYSREEIIGLKAGETYVHPEDRLKFKQKIGCEGFVRDHEIKLRKKDGTEMECLLTAIVRRTADGNILGYQGIIRDITERKRAEEEYRTILRTTMDGFWITDIQGRFLDVNDAYCQLIGYSRDELLTMKISDMEAVERPEETAQRIQRIMETGGTRFETRHRCKDGRMIDLEVSVNYTKIGGKQLFVFLRDITERKRIEEEREKLIHELQDALANIKTLRGLLPICSYCKKIRDDKGYWNRIESYIQDHSGAEFTHGMCPECLKKHYPDLVD
jgi:PAS domain S-box-containing protein